MDMRIHILIFESLQLEGSYVRDLLYKCMCVYVYIYIYVIC